MERVEPEGREMMVMAENERIQVHRIRELESEQLEVDEVDSDSHSGNSSLEGHGGGGGGGQPHGGLTFDTSLTYMHSYLGEVDDIICRRSFLDGGAFLNLPMFYLEGIVLFPEATLPLRVLQPRFKAAIELAIRQEEAPYTLGVVHVRARPQDNGLHVALVGTTAEIRRLRHLEDGSINVVTRGRQRFRTCHAWSNVDGAPCAQVQIIQEDTPLHIPRDAFGALAAVHHIESGKVPRPVLKSTDSHTKSEKEDLEHNSYSTQDEEGFASRRLGRHDNDEALQVTNRGTDENSSDDEIRHRWWWRRRRTSRRTPIQQERQRRLIEEHEDPVADDLGRNHGSPSMANRSRRDEGWGGSCKAWAADESNWLLRAQRSAWPHWVYRMYDAYDLARRAADMWRQMVELPSLDDMVRKPELLSYHIASKMPVQDATRQELLEIDGVVQRLRKEIQLLESMDLIQCKSCLTVIARRSDMLVMSPDGPIGAYVNNHGYVHETLTLCRAHGLILQGMEETSHSWFPGYSWTIADCNVCRSHMGWLFKALKKNMHPRDFWGVRRSQLAENTS